MKTWFLNNIKWKNYPTKKSIVFVTIYILNVRRILFIKYNTVTASKNAKFKFIKYTRDGIYVIKKMNNVNHIKWFIILLIMYNYLIKYKYRAA